VQPNTDFDVVAVVSGLEPQRTIFEDYLILEYKNRSKKTLIVRGQPQSSSYQRHIGNVTLVPHLPDAALAEILLGARKIICRSGYSSIMDLDALGCLQKAEWVPTPGQTEQEYLYSIHS
ncbi:MAG TPA: hypothetical protein VI413_12030, partial [Paludibacter sp.]